MCECVSCRSPPPRHPAPAETWLCSSQVLSSSAQLSSVRLRAAITAADEARVSCAHSPPPQLCYCWPSQRGTQLRTRGLAEAFTGATPQGLRKWLDVDGGPCGCRVVVFLTVAALFYMAMSSQSVGPRLRSKLKYLNYYFDGLSWFFVQTFLFSRGLLLLVMVIKVVK